MPDSDSTDILREFDLEPADAGRLSRLAGRLNEHLKQIEQLGFNEVTLRITSWNQREQTGPGTR